MASPPPYRSPMTSPPHPPHITLPNPKKRPSLAVNSFGPSSKRRKAPSIASTMTPGTSHPLRQTSFPPEESPFDLAAERSPSVESDVTGVTGGRSVVTAGVGSRKGKGKRKRKSGEGSVRSGGKTIGGEEASASGLAGEEAAEEEEDDGDVDDGVQDEEGRKVDKAAEKKNLAVLVDAFNEDQAERYNMFRRIKLRKETVRKITNQTLSQSVPPSVITTINGYTKVFIGLLVERARSIQQQEATPPPTPPAPPAPSSFPPKSAHDPNSIPPSSNTLPNSSDSGSFHNNTNKSDGVNGTEIVRGEDQNAGSGQPKKTAQQQQPPAPPPRDLGPLLPDHLREAIRRFRRDGEGDGTGMGGWSLGMGMPGKAAARRNGKRLFS